LTLGPDKQRINVDAGGSENAVFGFKAASAIKDGKQRVTAIATTDSDAIEKPVTVRPNGEEIVPYRFRVFNGSNVFDVNFPANALPRNAEGRAQDLSKPVLARIRVGQGAARATVWLRRADHFVDVS
jgi:hypothetical protein